jgi:hypothetical protein
MEAILMYSFKLITMAVHLLIMSQGEVPSTTLNLQRTLRRNVQVAAKSHA